jgi:hypothetical protein
MDKDCYPAEGLRNTLQKHFDYVYGTMPGVKVDAIHNFQDFTYDIRLVVQYDPMGVLELLAGFPWIESVVPKPIGLFGKEHVQLAKSAQVG